MYAIILAAGFGKRTQGILSDTPKCLVKTADGNTILEHLITDLSLIPSISQIIIATNEKYFASIKKSTSSRNNIIVTSNGKTLCDDRLGALGDLDYALERLGRLEVLGDVIVTPSDTTYWRSFSLKGFFDYQKQFPFDFVTIVRDVKDKKIIRHRFGNPVLNGQNIITSFTEKPDEPKSTLVSTPFYVYRKKHMKLLHRYLQEEGNPDSPGMIIPYLLKHDQIVRAFTVENKIIDAGTPEDIEAARKY